MFEFFTQQDEDGRTIHFYEFLVDRLLEHVNHVWNGDERHYSLNGSGGLRGKLLPRRHNSKPDPVTSSSGEPVVSSMPLMTEPAAPESTSRNVPPVLELLEREEEELETVPAAESALFVMVLELFYSDKVSTVEQFLSLLDGVVTFARQNKLTLNIRATDLPESPQTDFNVTVEHFESLTRSLRTQWQKLSELQKTAQLPSDVMKALIKLTLDTMATPVRVTMSSNAKLDRKSPQVVNLRKRIQDIMMKDLIVEKKV